MNQRFANVTIFRESPNLSLAKYTDDFTELIGFSSRELKEHFDDNFKNMLCFSDILSTKEMFVDADTSQLLPWLFTLKCKTHTLPVLLQIFPSNNADCIDLRVYNASFLSEQISKLNHHISSLKESIPSGLCQMIFDEYCTIIWYNQYFLDIIGYNEKQFEDELHSEGVRYVISEDMENISKLISDSLANGTKSVVTEMRIKRRDGEIRNVLTSLSFTDEILDGFPVLYSVGIDVTDQRRTHELEAEAELIKLAMDQASSYILEYDLKKRRLFVTESLKKKLGTKLDCLDNIPESLVKSGMILPDYVDSIRKLFLDLEVGLSQSRQVIGFHRKHGGDVWFRMQLTMDDSHSSSNAILFIEDVTEHYKIEMRYKEEENLRAAMTYSMDFSFQINLSTKYIISANEAKFPFFDFGHSRSSSEFLDTRAGVCVHPDDKGKYLLNLDSNYMLDLFSKGIPEVNFDFRIKDKKGTYRWQRGVGHIIKEPTKGHIWCYFYSKDIEDEKHGEIELRRHAEHDSLTGLLNRYTMEIRSITLLSEMNKYMLTAMYMLDLDNFKYLNDNYGHFRGDKMLCSAANSLRKIFGESALLGRNGGDELMVVQPCCSSVAEAERKAQLICDTFRKLEEAEGIVTASVGIAFAPKDSKSFSDLYKLADEALYQAKRAGKNCWYTYKKDESNDHSSEIVPLSRDWFLEESSDIVYVCNFYTYDLLYMNYSARTIFGITDNSYLGKKCYQILQNKNSPCEFCTNHLLCREKFYNWEFRNVYVGKSLLLRDRIINWFGTPARIEFGTDVSNIEKQTKSLEIQIQMDKVMIDCLKFLRNNKTLDESINFTLEQLLCFYKAGRAFILDYIPTENQLVFHWSYPPKNKLFAKKFSEKSTMIPDKKLYNCIQNNELFLFDQREIPTKNTANYYHVLYDSGITCQRCLPFYTDGRPAGIIGIDNPSVNREEFNLLKEVADLFFS